MSESDLYANIIEAVRASGYATVWRNQSGSAKVRGGYMHLAPPGAPDLVGWSSDGRFVGLEVKLPGKSATLIQEAWRQQILKAGGIAAVVHSPQEAVEALFQAVRLPEIDRVLP